MKARLLLISLLALGVAPSCVLTQDCSLAGCGGALLRIFVEGPDRAALDDASYEIVVDLDGVTYTGECVVPQPGTTPCAAFEGEGPRLVEATVLSTGTISILVRDQEDAGPRPSEVSLLVTAEGTTVADEQWSPSYETTYPNGEECGPACTSAEARTVVVPPGG